MSRMAGDALTGRYSGEDEYGKWGDTWTDAHQQQLRASGAYDADSELGRLYGGLEENISSRVDDEEGWRQLDIDGKLRDPKAYQDLVEKYAAAGFDVRAIDMADNYHSSNIAIRPGDYTVRPGSGTDDGGGGGGGGGGGNTTGTGAINTGAVNVVNNPPGVSPEVVQTLIESLPTPSSTPAPATQNITFAPQDFTRTFGNNTNTIGSGNMIYGAVNQGNQDNSFNFGYQGVL